MSKPTLNWQEDSEAVLVAMGKIEGDHWLQFERKYIEGVSPSGIDYRDEDQFPGYGTSVHSAIKRMDELNGGLWPAHCETVYGGGGWNRYFFRHDGRVDFSASHIDPDTKLDQVEELGFYVFGS